MIIAICDDDKKANENLRKMIKSYTHNKEIEKCEIHEYPSGDALLEEFAPKKFDIIFLDIEMPGTDGFDTAGKIRELDLNVDIVFITNLKESVQRGFDYNAKGYLYKGVTEEQIHERMDKLVGERLHSTKDAFMKIKQVKGGTVLLPLSRVQYFESNGHYISVVSEYEQTVFIDSITNLSKKLEGKGFIQASRSNIVNLDYVFNMTGDMITIKKGDSITVGRSYKQALKKALEKRVIEKWKM